MPVRVTSVSVSRSGRFVPGDCIDCIIALDDDVDRECRLRAPLAGDGASPGLVSVGYEMFCCDDVGSDRCGAGTGDHQRWRTAMS